jgi:WD40 repeat protein
VLIWDVAERELAASLNQHSGAVRAVAFHPDGTSVASAGDDRSVTLWDSAVGRKRRVLGGHETRVVALSFSPDGRTLGSLDQDGRMILWTSAAGTSRVKTGPNFPGYALAISTDGRRVATTSGIYSALDGHPLQTFRNRSDWIYGALYAVSFSKDGRHLVGATDDGWILHWDAASGVLRQRHRHPPAHTALSISPDSKWLVTGDIGGAVRLWSLSPFREEGILGRHRARVKSVAFSPDGATVASAGDDEAIALWDVESRTLETRIGTHASPVYSIAFSADGRQLVSGEHDRSVRVYGRRRTLWGFDLE